MGTIVYRRQLDGPLAERQAALSRVRFGQRSVRRGAQDDALPLPREGMPQVVLGQD